MHPLALPSLPNPSRRKQGHTGCQSASDIAYNVLIKQHLKIYNMGNGLFGDAPANISQKWWISATSVFFA
jgi:hypothetical protein